MASTITKVKTIRVANETADFFEGVALNRLVECIHHAMESGKIEFDGTEMRILGGNSVNTAPEYEDLSGMMEYYGLTMDDFVKQSDAAFTEGTLTISDGKIECVLPDWAVKLSDACHEIGYDVDKIVDSAIKSLKKGSL